MNLMHRKLSGSAVMREDAQAHVKAPKPAASEGAIMRPAATSADRKSVILPTPDGAKPAGARPAPIDRICATRGHANTSQSADNRVGRAYGPRHARSDLWHQLRRSVGARTISQLADAMSAQVKPSIWSPGLPPNVARLMIPPLIVPVTRAPTSTAPPLASQAARGAFSAHNSQIAAARQACGIVRERDETEVAKELAT